uniref:Predicted protein n=1 Tax=Hordeum vulgare subsp. vulgare TaxID=112509 RepID=F2D443_HORVV|nr:predicted protein [Hordeum vulgare subsp. vulgare]
MFYNPKELVATRKKWKKDQAVSSFVVICEHMKFVFLLICFHEGAVLPALFKLILKNIVLAFVGPGIC